MAGIFQVNYDSDGAWNINGFWYSKYYLKDIFPRELWYNFNRLAILAYITEEEYNLILTNFPDYVSPSQVVGYIEANNPETVLNFIGPQLPPPSVVNFAKTQSPFVNNAPYYFIPEQGGRIHKLVYITTEARDFLIEQDIYGIGLATTAYFGPYGIPIYDSGSGASCSAASAAAASVSGSPCGPGSVGIGCFGGPSFDGFSSNEYQIPIFSESGIYDGSLSAQGNMLAMQLGEGEYQYNSSTGAVKPYHSGYFKEYLKDPRGDIFGANTLMPALTGVMPDKFTDMPGNAIYYTDLALYRISGGNQFDQFYFVNAFTSAVGWVLTVNNYLAALKKAEDTNLAYYGADSFQVLTTQGFNKYQVGNALVTAFRNIGLMASVLTSGYFGTANAVADVMLENGLGYINNLSLNLYTAGVNFDDIGNSLYTDIITQELRQITNPADIETIQEVLGSTIPNMFNPLDYTRIDRASGLPNDSEFATFAEVGLDFFKRAPNLILQTGQEIADLINNVQSNVTANVESLTGNTLINQETIDSLRNFLPIGANNEPITMLNVIGMASGYQSELMREVNDGIAQLYATQYGTQIRDTFTEISRLSARLPLTTAEQTRDIASWDRLLEQKKDEYYTLVNTIVADTTGNIPAIVNQINDNYDKFTTNLYYEIKNYEKSNINVTSYGDTISVLTFVQSIPGYSADTANIATDYMLYGLTQDTLEGEVARTVLDTGKNDLFFRESGVTIVGTLGA